MKVWFLAIMAILVLFLAGCHDAVNQDILDQSCKSDKPVPIYCEKFSADDYSKTLTFSIRVIDSVNMSYSSINISGLDCQRKNMKSTIGYYIIIVKCADFYNQNITGKLEFDYQFLGKPKHTVINFVRKFGKKDPVMDRQPLDDSSAETNIYG
jgi:hypothetical protein